MRAARQPSSREQTVAEGFARPIVVGVGFSTGRSSCSNNRLLGVFK